ncbi:hypothetical protein ACFY1L_50405 [Streptomyces sp. NPDC001663]|uniref:hypothetical protein n=1 Tax=Streptomyces sp. NPDC001663 TaxID=3364597 RepID=UPI003689EFC4
MSRSPAPAKWAIRSARSCDAASVATSSVVVGVCKRCWATRAKAAAPDPLHLAEVFGLDEKTAMRSADSARALLEQAAEQRLR